jgi:uncharacterized protein (TIGR02145 family)
MGLFFGQNQIFSASLIKYGYLYNWYTASGIAATGWSVPTDAQWTTMTSYIGGLTNTAGKLKETGLLYWTTPNTGATNELGFWARGTGNRGSTGSWYGLTQWTYFWTSTAYSSSNAYYRLLSYNSNNITTNNSNRKSGYSIRLIKNSTTLTHGQTGTYIGNNGRVYPTICIGTQEWLACNLAETLYSNGSSISIITDNTAWANASIGAMCAFNNDIDNVFL